MTATATRLNDTQLVILSAAATRDDHMALPLPDSLGQDDPETGKAIANLLRRKLLEEIDVAADAPAWRSDDERSLGLKVTDKALDAIGINKGDTTDPKAERAHSGQQGKLASRSRRKGHDKTSATKAETVLRLLRRKNGASIEEMIETTGWQAHSVRGFLSGTIKKRMGCELTSEKNAKGERRYRIADA